MSQDNQPTTEKSQESRIQTEDTPSNQAREVDGGLWNVSSVSNLAQKWLPTLAGLGIVFAVGGYVILNLALDKYTDIPLHNIASSQFLSAGLSGCVYFLICFLGAYLVKDVKNILFRLLLAALLSLMVAILLSIAFHIQSLSSGINGLLLFLVNPFRYFLMLSPSMLFLAVFYNEYRKNEVYSLLFILISIVAVMSVYGVFYHILPRVVGGGHPSSIQVIFINSEIGQSIGLEMKTEVETVPLCMLSELTDAYLFFAPSSKQTLAIKKDYVLAVRDTGEYLDCSPPDRNSAPATSTPSPTSNPTPTQP
ncbi:MAG: hypothetical protein KC708_17695 [Anaerolineae bacterium]|nr:hypothetical protein [Anaerolineae bacterium]